MKLIFANIAETVISAVFENLYVSFAIYLQKILIFLLKFSKEDKFSIF